MTNEKTSHTRGLTAEQARKLQEKFGRNELTPQKKQSFIRRALHTINEPLFFLLLKRQNDRH